MQRSNEDFQSIYACDNNEQEVDCSNRSPHAIQSIRYVPLIDYDASRPQVLLRTLDLISQEQIGGVQYELVRLATLDGSRNVLKRIRDGLCRVPEWRRSVWETKTTPPNSQSGKPDERKRKGEQTVSGSLYKYRPRLTVFQIKSNRVVRCSSRRSSYLRYIITI